MSASDPVAVELLAIVPFEEQSVHELERDDFVNLIQDVTTPIAMSGDKVSIARSVQIRPRLGGRIGKHALDKVAQLILEPLAKVSDLV